MIEILGDGHHRFAVQRIDGFSSCLHLAAIVDAQGQHHTAFIKAFPTYSKGIANEIAGWVLSHKAGLPAPERAWIIGLQVGRLRRLFPEQEWPGQNDDLMLTWATKSLSPVATDCYLSLDDADVWAERIQAWPQLHDAVIQAELLHNVDANAGNLVAIDETNFAVVDFADILGGQDWSAATVKKLDYFHNKLNHLAWGGLPGSEDQLELSQSMRRVAQAWYEARPVVAQWWSILIDRAKDREGGLAFVDRNAKAMLGENK